jgi:transcriptional regulator NrdR family protein
MTLTCPDCGQETLELIETTEPDGTDEYKEVRTCPSCENIVYIIRRTDG